METGHAYLPLCIGGWGDNDPGSQGRLGGQRIYFRVFVIVEVVVGGIVAVFLQQSGRLCTHQAHLFPGATLETKPYIGNTDGHGSRYSKTINYLQDEIPGWCYTCFLKAL